MKKIHITLLSFLLVSSVIGITLSFARSVDSAVPQIAVKSVDESITGFDIAPQDDDELVLFLDKNKKYLIHGNFFPYGEGGGMRIAATAPTGSMFIVGYDSGQGSGVLEESGVEGPTTFGFSDSNPIAVSIDGIVTTGNQSGEFRLQWGQLSPSDEHTKVVKRGSFLMAEQI